MGAWNHLGRRHPKRETVRYFSTFINGSTHHGLHSFIHSFILTASLRQWEPVYHLVIHSFTYGATRKSVLVAWVDT